MYYDSTYKQRSYSILLVDDSVDDCFTHRRLLNQLRPQMSFEIREVHTGAQAVAQCKERLPDCILLDYGLGDTDGIRLLLELNAGRDMENDPLCAAVIITGRATQAQVAVVAMKSGAQDYLVKDVMVSEDIGKAIQNAVDRVQMRRDLRESEARFRLSLDNMIDCFSIYSAVREVNSGEIIDFRCNYVNDPACVIYDMSREELVGRLLVGDSHPGDLVFGLFDEYKHLIESGLPLQKTNFIDGTSAERAAAGDLIRAFDIRAWKMGDGFAVLWRDVTDQRNIQFERAENARESKRIAESVQKSLLLMPDTDAYPGLSVHCFYKSANDDSLIGGDFFDVFAVSDHEIALVVGDATGKGLAAATYTAEIKFALRAYLKEHNGNLQTALALLNDFIVVSAMHDAVHMHGSYVALTAVIVNTETGSIASACAGGEPPLIARAEEGTTSMACAFGPLLGAMRYSEYSSHNQHLNCGDYILLTTDGVTEARLKGGDLFGIDRVASVLSEFATNSVSSLADIERELLRRTLIWSNDRQYDDICFLIARRS